jgi:triosephosphate isomerase
MRTPLVVGNWKMHGTVSEAKPLATGVRDGVRRVRGVEVVVCPPFTALAAVADLLRDSAVALGAQNCHWDAHGAHTGEISAAMLTELGCRYVILGHSERRKEIGESDDVINRKMTAVFGRGLTPILCVGETAEERRQGLTFTTVEGQLRAGLARIAPETIATIVLAYEPVWAIGTGQNATAAQAAEVHGYLRGILSELTSKETAQAIRILYGGSVKADNAAELCAAPDIDGALVGGASLKPIDFVAIAKHAARAGTTARGD